MLRWMNGKIRHDMIKNESIRENVRIATIIEKIEENRLLHVREKKIIYFMVRVNQMEKNQTTKRREKLKKTIREVIKKNIEINDLNINMILNKLEQKLVHITDFI